MKVLLIGRSGQVAQSLLAVECPADIELVAVGRPELDVTDADSIAAALAVVAPDAVVNAAAYTAVDRAESEDDVAQALNADGVGKLAEKCSEINVPLIHISTDYVFDGAKDTAYLETDPVGPLGVYGRTKLAGERAVAAKLKRHIILRTSWVYSPFGQNFVKTMLRLAGERETLNVVDDQVGTPTYAPHLAEAIIEILKRIKTTPARQVPWGLYHVAGQGETTWCGLARTVFEISTAHGGPAAHVDAITTAEYPTAARRPANSRLNCDKLERVFDIRLPPLSDGVRDCVTALLLEAGQTSAGA